VLPTQSLSSAMAEHDRVKEQIAYLKYWQGIMVVTDISVLGWMMSVAGDPPWRTFTLAALGVIALSFGILDLHRRIDRRIDRLGGLSWLKRSRRF
jgi:hypothetical protein